jgi:lipooligosaccharide transport system permease protein
VIYGTSFFTIVAAFGLAPLPHALLVLPVMMLSGLLFASIGITFSLLLTTIDFFSFYYTLFLTPLFLFSDVFFPLAERLSPGWQRVAEVLPLLHPVRLARAAFHGGGSPLVVAWDLAYIIGLSLTLLALARRSVRRRLTT